MLAEPDAALSEAGLKGIYIFEILVSGDLPQQRPEMFGGVEFRGIRRQEHEPQVVRHDKLRRAVPRSAIEHK